MHLNPKQNKKVFDYLCLAETVKHFRPVIYSSFVHDAVPRHFRKSAQKKELSEYLAYLKALQTG